MELKAALEGLRMLKEKCKVNLYSDSSYLINAFNLGWLDNWVRNGWRKQDKAPVKNADLWSKLYDHNKKHIITWIKVKGHSNNELNNRCDQAAVEQIKLLKEGIDGSI
jgi:ribonuclease HI